jgi:hypothetical protein
MEEDMRAHLTLVTIAVLATTLAAFATPAATLTLQSSKNGLTVAPSATIDWTIAVQVSSGDNSGLALVSTDFTQDAANPELFILPVASGVPAGMTNFARPAGIANPDEGGLAGYRGVQRPFTGTTKNLIQIGGGQNTFGTALAPGTGIGESATVVLHVGQGTPQTVATGSFAAPATEGTYTFRLANGLANVLDLNSPPGFSKAVAATVNGVSTAVLTFTVHLGPSICHGDMNCDRRVTFADIDPFVAALSGESAWNVSHPGCPWLNADCNNSGTVNFADIDPFVAVIGTTCN